MNTQPKDMLKELIRVTKQQQPTRIQTDIRQLVDQSQTIDEMLRVIKQIELPENPYSISYLQDYYNDYKKTHELEAELTELFSEGWLVECMGEWRFTAGMKSQYHSMGKLPTEHLQQIVDFMDDLSKVPYTDAISIEGIDLHNEWWEKHANYVLGKWWDELIQQEQMDQWGKVWSLFPHCWNPDFYTQQKEKLFEWCLEQLEQAPYPDWDQMKNIMGRKCYVEYKNIHEHHEKYVLSDFPELGLEKYDYFARRVDTFWYLSHPFSKGIRYANLCVRCYNRVSTQLKKRFLDCLKIPYVYLQLESVLIEPALWADALEIPELYSLCTALTLQQWREYIRDHKKIGESIVQEGMNALLDIWKEHAAADGKHIWEKVLLELSAYITVESAPYCKFSSDEKTYYGWIRDIYIKWYIDHDMQNTKYHDAILEFHKKRFMEERDIYAARSFVEYINFTEMHPDQETGQHIFTAYMIFMNRALKERWILTSIEWRFWKKKIWKRMIEELVQDERSFRGFCGLITVDGYEEAVEQRKGNSPILNLGVIWMVRLYLLTIPLNQMNEEIDQVTKTRFEKILSEYFKGCQIECCDPFTSESIRLLQMESVMGEYMDAIMHLVNDLSIYTPAKLLTWLPYIKKQNMKMELLRTICQEDLDTLMKDIYFLPTMRNLQDQILQICFSEEFEEKEMLIQIAKDFLQKYKDIIQKRSMRNKKEEKIWVESAEMRLRLLQGKESEILELPESDVADFYKAFILLNGNRIVDLQQAARLYENSMKKDPGNKTLAINYYASCVRICTHEQSTDDLRKEYVTYAEKTFEIIRTSYSLDQEAEELLYSNTLFLYLMLKNREKFWYIASELPDELHHSLACAQYMLPGYLEVGDQKKAELLLADMEQLYGSHPMVEQMKKQLEEFKITGYSESIEKIPQIGMTQESKIQRLRNAWNELMRLDEEEGAAVRLQYDDLEDRKEAHILYMVLTAVEELNKHTDYVMFQGNTAPENTYNKLLEVLLEQKNCELFGYFVKDQSQDGTTGNQLANGRHGVGSLDLKLCHGQRDISIIEGIKLSSMDSGEIQKHIRKMAGYNYSHCKTVFLFVQMDMKNPKASWNRYEQNILPDIIQKTSHEDWHIIEQIPKSEIELVRKKIVDTQLHMCRTTHVCESTGQTYHMYHMMLDIQKYAEKDEAKKARNV